MEEQIGRGSGNKDDKGKRIYSSLLFLSMLEEIIHETTSHPFLELIQFSGQETNGSFGCLFATMCSGSHFLVSKLLIKNVLSASKIIKGNT